MVEHNYFYVLGRRYIIFNSLVWNHSNVHMKFLLIISICSQIHLECLPPMVHDVHFNTHYECAMKGYKIAKDMMTDLGQDHVNQDGIVIAFKCQVGSEV